MLKKESNEIKTIMYIFLTIIISMGQSILLINRVYSNNVTAILIIHFLSCLPPLFLFEQIIDRSSKPRFFSMLFALYCVLVFSVFPEQLITDNGLRVLVKVFGTLLPVLVAMFLYRQNQIKQQS